MKIAVIGCGYWGKNHVRNFRELGALAMVCDATEAGRELASELAPDATVTADVDRVLDSNVDGVVIATPAETHYALARRALEAGKDVLVEKPLALRYTEGLALQRLAAREHRILMVGHVLEYHPAILRLRELVASGDLGTLRYIYSNRLSLGKIRREENILWSFAPHDVAIILRLYDALPLQVTATGGAYVQPNIFDVTVTNLLFDQGKRAHIFVSWLHPFKEQRLVIIGDRRMASFDDVGKKLTVYDQHVKLDLNGGAPVPVRGTGEEVPFADAEPLRQECTAFLRAISDRLPPIADGLSGARVLAVLEASQRSLVMGGQQVTVPEDAGERPLARPVHA